MIVGVRHEQRLNGLDRGARERVDLGPRSVALRPLEIAPRLHARHRRIATHAAQLEHAHAAAEVEAIDVQRRIRLLGELPVNEVDRVVVNVSVGHQATSRMSTSLSPRIAAYSSVNRFASSMLGTSRIE